ncbi:interleukin-31 receptor subunit alpha isoform X2 [Lates calcarifer]|uniref:Interleukin-31 receptor subunit alpha isoform X2 n=1 Tax=Lates calcarifer TaxID=8187 RepID=A0A4W6CQE8_LATCA|nr:interleukin-31 receptor subunit alpha isoform X2 [Lates calcarifer]
MVGRGFQFDLSDSCASHSHLLILGLILVYYTTLASYVQGVSCKSKNFFSKYQHCTLHPDGVHDLNCYGKPKNLGMITCMWRPGNLTSEKTYTLAIQQPDKKNKYCKAYTNIRELSQGKIPVFEVYNIVAEVFENSESNCTKAVFKDSPKHLLLCSPPYHASFSRHSGKLDVDVRWQQEDAEFIKYYSVRYKALGSLSWNEPPMQSHNGVRCTVENLNSSLVYTVQIQCVTNEKCSQCPWSQHYTVSPELTAQPVIVNLQDTDIAEKKGRRLLSLNWTFPAKELHDHYYVTIGKASGEASQRIKTSRSEIRLSLSYSAYHLSISAVNNVSTSPAVSKTIPQREDIPSVVDEKLNITVHSNTSFTVYWKDDLIKTYVCYSVEWREKGHKAVHKPFYQDAVNQRTLSHLPEPLEPYKRYSISLHTRPNKETCDMKYINNSESTYGTTQFYFIEGSPISAPINISSYNVTLSSAVLQWSSILEEDVRGFLLGYIIYYTEYKGTSTERNITVDPEFDTYKLENLKKGTAYQVQISGFTQAGAGVRSTPMVFVTNHQGYFDLSLSGVIIIFVVVSALLIVGSVITKRAKVILWPSIPNPGNSDAMQKIEGPCGVELLESINTLKVEEWDTNSLQIIEKEPVVPPSMLPSVLPLLHNLDDEEDSPETNCNWTHTDTEDATEDILSDDATDTFSNIKQTNFQSSPFPFSSEYTTMEMFQQAMPQSIPETTAITQAMESDPEDTPLTVGKPGLDYIGQFGTSPVSDSEEMATIL